MFPSRRRRLIVPLEDEGELTVVVEDHTAILHLVTAAPADDDLGGGAGTDPEFRPESARETTRVRIPARALVAALRVAWADEHDLRCFEPWRDATREGYWRGYEPYDRYGHERWWDDLGDGDPEGYRDPTVVPFPYRPPVRPARSGAPWEEHEHQTLREMWLGAEPDTDKAELVRSIAERLERGPGGVGSRLRLAGCDPTRPGCPWEGPSDADADAADTDVDAVALDG